MPFDPSQPFEVEAGPERIMINPSRGFDPSQPFQIEGAPDIGAAFDQFSQQPQAPAADQQRMEQLASAYRRAPEGQGMQVDSRAQELAKTNNPYVQATMQGLTFGLADELGAGIQTLTGQGAYGTNLAALREFEDRAKAANPVGMMGAELTGALVTAPFAPAVRVAQGAGLLPRVANSAATGAAYGGAYGFGAGEGMEGRATGAMTGAAIGGAIGGPLGAITPAARVATPSAGEQAALAGERIGVQLPRVAASDSPTVQRVGQAVSNVPWAGRPVGDASRRAIEQTGQAAERVAGDLSGSGAAATAQSAGATAKAGLERYVTETTKGRVEKLYDAVDNLVNPNVTAPLKSTAQTVQAIAGRRQAAGLRGDGSAIDTVIDAVARPQGLTYEGVKTLRTRVGEMLKNGLLPADISQAELKQIYGSLSDDLRGAVQAAGSPKALQAFERANTYNRLVSDRRENLARLLKAPNEEGVFERIARAAGSTSTADTKLLSQARKALPADEWNEIASAVVDRMGRASDNQFSAERFVTAYGKLSPEGKRVLFRSAGKADLAQALDDIATVSSRFKDLSRYANPSGTFQQGAAAGIGAGLFAEPVTTVSTLLGGRVMSEILARPATARSMARWAKTYQRLVAAPARGTLASAKAASQRFASDIGRELGLTQYTQQINQALQNAVANPSANDGVENPRPVNE